MSPALRRFALFALLAIALPAATVAVLGYVSLRQWEGSVEARLREQARDVASMAAEKVEMVLRLAEDALLARLESAIAADDGSHRALDAFLAQTPLVGQLSLVDRRGRPLYPPASRGAPAHAAAALLAQAGEDLWARGGRRHVAAEDALLLAAIVRSRDGTPLLAVLSRSGEGLGHEIFDKALGALEAPTILAVLDPRGRTIWSGGPIDEAALLVSVPFREGLPSWRLALYEPPGTSPLVSVRRQVALFTAAFGVLLAVIVAGLTATWRLVRRETEMARLKSDFVASVSHDLKTPLSVIRMFGETLEMGRVADDAARQEYYRVIARESERLTRLIDNVLDFSRIEGGRRAYTIVPTTVEPLIRETLEAFSYPLAQQGFEVEVRIAPGLPDVPIDADAVGQALANLIDNAIKYSAERKSLGVEAYLSDGELAITVTDRGVGIPREEVPRIFDRFYRVGRSETQGRRGSGVGLALVRHIAEAHGGRVTVDSRPGEGSGFTLWLPLGGTGTRA